MEVFMRFLLCLVALSYPLVAVALASSRPLK